MLDNPQPPVLLIPKYFPDYPLARPKPLQPAYFPTSCVSPVQSDSPATVEDDAPSPHSPHSASATNYHYAHRSSGSFDDMYDTNLPSNSYSASYQHPNSPYQFMDSDATVRLDRPYLSESPSPDDPHPPSSYPSHVSATHSRYRRSSYIDPEPDIDPDRYSDKFSDTNNSYSQPASLDQRRMSEPAILGSYTDSDSQRIQSQINYSQSSHNIPRASYIHSLHRGVSMGSLRDLRHAHLDYPAHVHQPYWKDDGHHRSNHLENYHADDGFDGPISPLQPDFSGGLGPRGTSLQYSPTTENPYGPSPPGTGTSTSSLGPLSPTAGSFAPKDDLSTARDGNGKTYSFVALPGNAVKKRPRRRYDEIERLYQCSWPDCNKAYGTLNHLNAHVTMQKHGVKRQPNEFKELRKQWRKAKKSTSPGPMRRASVGMRHDGHEYNARRYESQSESNTPLYSRQPSYSSVGLPSSAPSALSEPNDRAFPVDVNRYQLDDRDEQFPLYNAQPRQRYNSSVPWQNSSRSTPQQQYLSSSLPSPSSAFPQPTDTHLPLETRAPQPQRARPRSSLDPSMGRLPPDSTLLTPLPGYQPSLLTPLQEGESQDINYPAGPGFEMYNDGHEERPHTGHGSLGNNDEKY